MYVFSMYPFLISYILLAILLFKFHLSKRLCTNNSRIALSAVCGGMLLQDYIRITEPIIFWGKCKFVFFQVVFSFLTIYCVT